MLKCWSSKRLSKVIREEEEEKETGEAGKGGGRRRGSNSHVRHYPARCWSTWVSRTRQTEACRAGLVRHASPWRVSQGGRRSDMGLPGQPFPPPATMIGDRRSGSACSRLEPRPSRLCNETTSRNDRENWRGLSGTSDCTDVKTTELPSSPQSCSGRGERGGKMGAHRTFGGAAYVTMHSQK